MKVSKVSARNLQFIEADLRDYLNDPSDFTCEYIENIHILLLDVMHRMGVTPISEDCKYCGGNCPNDEDHACDGYLGDIDGLYSEDASC